MLKITNYMSAKTRVLKDSYTTQSRADSCWLFGAP
jgi:hypothetical protein